MGKVTRVSAEIGLKEDMIPDSAHILLFVLSHVREVLTELKLQKLVFQVQNEAKVPGGYPYFKHHYGPFSRELHLDTLTLSNQGLVRRELLMGQHGAYSKYSLTDLGKKYFDGYSLSKFKQRDIMRMREILDLYSAYKPHDLAELVYRQWRIKEPQGIDAEINELSGSLNTVMRFWESLYFPECVVITYYLAFVEYAIDALAKVALSSDIVVKSVLLNACKELNDKLGTIADVCSKSGECPANIVSDICNSTAPSVYEVFGFIEDFCERNNILHKLAGRDIDELMTEEEYQRLLTSFQELD